MRSLEYSRLNLNVDRFGRRVSPSLTRERRGVSGMLWEEKASDALFFVQSMAVLWLMSAAWPWPFQWLRWTRFTLWFLLDAPSFFEHRGDGWAPASVAAYSVLLAGALGALALGHVLLARLYYARRTDRRDLPVSALTFERASAFGAELLYMPAAALGARFVVCDADGAATLLGGGMQCWSGEHWVVVAIAFAALAAPLAAYPLVTAARVRKLTVFDDAAAHERYLASREMEYLVGVNELYEVDRVFLCASFTRRFVQGRAWRCARKLALVAILYALGPDTAGTSAQGLQAAFFCAAVATPWLVRLWHREYRARSSNLLGRVLEACLFANSVVGVFSAGGAKTSLLVDSTLSVLLAMLNLSLLALYVLAAAWSTAVARDRWPVTERDVEALLEKDVEMLRLLNEGKRAVDDSAECPGEFVSKRDLGELIRGLDRHRRSALARDHLLAWTLQDMTEELALIYENSQQLSLLPNEGLEGALEGLHDAMRQKQFDRLLLHPAKARALGRLAALRALLGDDYVYGDRREWHDAKGDAADLELGISKGPRAGLKSAAMGVMLSRRLGFGASVRGELARAATAAASSHDSLRTDEGSDSGHSETYSDVDEDDALEAAEPAAPVSENGARGDASEEVVPAAEGEAVV